MARHLRFWIALILLFAGGVGVRAEALPPLAIAFQTSVINDLPRKDVEISLRFWIEELSRSLNLPYKPVRFYDSMADLKRDMANGTVNFMVANSMDVAENFSLNEIAEGFAGYKSEPDHLLLVVRRDAGISRAADLIGKRLALAEYDQLAVVYLETLIMQGGGKPDEKSLVPIIWEQRSNKLAHRLFFGQADAALIYRNGYESALALNPQIGQRLKVLDDYSLKIRSPHIGLFSAQLRPEHREAIAQAAMKLNNTARGRQVLQIYLADSLVLTSPRDLAPFQRLLEQHRTLKAGQKGSARKGNP